MWSTFFVTDEEGRPVGAPGGGVQAGGMPIAGGPAQGPVGLNSLMSGRGTFGGGKRRRTTSGAQTMSEAQEGKLSPPKHFYNNQTCLTAHLGLWKGCTKTLWVADIDPERETCGPAELPGETNCTYFKFFTTGEPAMMFQKTTHKNLNMASAMLAMFSLFLMASWCCFPSSSSISPFLAFLSSDHTVPLHHELSWSVSCIGCAGAVLIVGGVLFLLLALPYSPWQRCLPQKTSSSSGT
ncbi:hypothetical protein WMY93_020141 [Mugilogobius chulae]|uniref:Uncharacterized protein n=1 Tax=Mugilogobius chulae TaxID=88201 RepID=A0AAW0NHK0_9GOBI